MSKSLAAQLYELEYMKAKELQAKYLDVFGHATASANREYLRKRIAWRLQSREEGSLSERARKRAAELANEGDLRSTDPRPPKAQPNPNPTVVTVKSLQRDSRLPAKGVILTRPFKGKIYEVTVGDRDFEYNGKRYTSLSTIAKEITGSRWNGYRFFGLA